jgi:hypothetical protein
MWIARINAGVVLSVIAWCAAPLEAGALEKCPDSPVYVSASSTQVRDLICQGAFEAIEMLKKCEIHIRRPVTVLTLEQVRHPLGQVIIALSEPTRERVLITAYEKIRDLIEETPYRVLPQGDF